MELGGTAQRLAGADATPALPGVMDDEHGSAMPALQLAQEGQQRGDLAAGILVDAVQPHERVEDQQARLQSCDGLGEVAAVGIEIETQDRRRDHLDIEVGERHSGSTGDAFEAAAHDVECVLGGEQQHPTGARHREPAQAGHIRCDSDGQIKGQERLAALGLAVMPEACVPHDRCRRPARTRGQ